MPDSKRINELNQLNSYFLTFENFQRFEGSFLVVNTESVIYAISYEEILIKSKQKIVFRGESKFEISTLSVNSTLRFDPQPPRP